MPWRTSGLAVLPGELGDGLAEKVARDVHEGEAPLVGRAVRIVRLDGQINRLGTCMQRHCDLGLAEIHLVPAAVSNTDDDMGHLRVPVRNCAFDYTDLVCRAVMGRTEFVDPVHGGARILELKTHLCDGRRTMIAQVRPSDNGKAREKPPASGIPTSAPPA